MKRVNQIFGLYDDKQKGYLTLDEFQRKLAPSFTYQQTEKLFAKADQDRDGKMNARDFCKILLPSQYEIQQE